jgi:DNA-binding NarL/FixJ family response regulator
MREPVVVRVHALDPISESGIITQLRQCRDVWIDETDALAGTAPRGAGDGESRADRPKPTVALAVADAVDEDVTRWLRALHRSEGLPVVLVVGQLDPRALATVVESGVRAVLRRCEATPQRLTQLLHATALDRSELPPELLRALLDQMSQLSRNLLEPRGLSLTGLTNRERDVLRLIADGMSTREVASELAYSERTIKTVVQDLTVRLQLRNRAHAVAYAVRNGWI